MNRGIIVVFVAVANSLPIKAPLRQIALSRAFATTMTEAFAINVFDTSSILRDLSCDCNEHPFLPIYVSGFIVFGYMYFIKNSSYDKLKRVTFYHDIKQTLRIILLTTFLILGKNIENAI